MAAPFAFALPPPPTRIANLPRPQRLPSGWAWPGLVSRGPALPLAILRLRACYGLTPAANWAN